MRWSNLFVIFRREVRDQIRDRRTLFMIFVLPILLYPASWVSASSSLRSALEQKPRRRWWWSDRGIPPQERRRCSNEAGDGLQSRNCSTSAGRVPSGWSSVTNRPSSPWAEPDVAASGPSAMAGVGRDDDPARTCRGAAPSREMRTRSTSRSSTTASMRPSQITYLRLREMLGRWRRSIVAGRLKRDRKTQRLRRADPGQGRGRRDRERGRGDDSGAGCFRSCWS